jgi:short-subunit dehydrogenase
MPRRSLAHARVLLTGASSGIGRELALALAGRRARLLLVARRQELLSQLVAECRALGAEADCLAGDLTLSEFRVAVVRRTVELWNGLDVLINNAGTSAHGRFAQSDEATLRQVMELNFFAATELTRLALPLLAKAGAPGTAESSMPTPSNSPANPQSAIRKPQFASAAIVNIGSVLGHRGVPFNSEYCASKFALRGWTESLRAELAADNVDVLLVSPGTVDTEFFDHLVAKRESPPWGKSRGISAAAAAEQTVRALERGTREIFPNWRSRLLVIANRLFPNVVANCIGRYGSRR